MVFVLHLIGINASDITVVELGLQKMYENEFRIGSFRWEYESIFHSTKSQTQT